MHHHDHRCQTVLSLARAHERTAHYSLVQNLRQQTRLLPLCMDGSSHTEERVFCDIANSSRDDVLGLNYCAAAAAGDDKKERSLS